MINSYVGLGSGLRVWQCVPITSGATYFLRGRMLVPSGQPTLRGGQLGLWWYSTAYCSGFLFTAVSPLVSWPEDVWVEVAAPLAVAPVEALSAMVSLEVNQWAPGGTVSILYDHLELEEVLFADGFVDGTAAAWAQVRP